MGLRALYSLRALPSRLLTGHFKKKLLASSCMDVILIHD